MNTLKPGMLAMVVGLKKDPHLNGQCVVLVELVNPGQDFIIPNTMYSNHLHSKYPASWVCTGELPKRVPSPVGGWGLFKPENLMPLEDGNHHFWDDAGIYTPQSIRIKSVNG